VQSGEVGMPSSLAHDQTSLKRVTESAPLVAGAAPVKSLHRPQFLQEPKPQSQTLRAYAAKLGLYFGTMADSMPGNGGETPWVQKVAGSEFNLLEPGNQPKWWMTEPSEGTFDFGLGDALDYAVGRT
jgi:endo-1,4-beta-xylanase